MSKPLFTTNLFLLGIIISLSLFLGALIFSSHKLLHCADFHSQREAQKAFNRGATYLDKNKDGVACQNLP